MPVCLQSGGVVRSHRAPTSSRLRDRKLEHWMLAQPRETAYHPVASPGVVYTAIVISDCTELAEIYNWTVERSDMHCTSRSTSVGLGKCASLLLRTRNVHVYNNYCKSRGKSRYEHSTLCLKKVLTFKLSVTLSNCDDWVRDGHFSGRSCVTVAYVTVGL